MLSDCGAELTGRGAQMEDLGMERLSFFFFRAVNYYGLNFITFHLWCADYFS